MNISSRHLDWPCCLNLRDLGGVPTQTSLTPWRVFIRGDDLSQLDDIGVQRLGAYGAHTIVDLRRPTEVLSAPHHPSLASVRYHHIPLLDDEPSTFDNLDAVYGFIVRSHAVRLVEICSLFAFAPTPLVFHCLHGKDRTGILAALLLSLAGASHQAILADYVLSDTYLKPLYVTLVAQAHPDQLARVLDDASCPPRRLQSVLDYWQQHGGVANYLLSAGLPSSTLATLLQRLR